MDDHHDPTIGEETLRAYLAETLGPDEMARVEKALRQSSSLRDRLEDVRLERGDLGLHTLGAIWSRNRLSCPSREQLGSFLLDVLDPEHAAYVAFHIDEVACPFCQANLDDLRARADTSPDITQTRRHRIYHSSRHLLGEGGD